MAIFTPSPLIGAISGRVGGVVFAKQKRSSVVRPIPRRRAKKTPGPNPPKPSFHFRAKNWDLMTDEFRERWNSLALTLSFPNRLGVNRHLSGFQLFMSNLVGRRVRPPNLFSPILDAASPFPLEWTFSFVQGGTYTVDYVVTGHIPLSNIRLYGARPYTSNPINFSNRYTFFFEDGLANNPHDVTTAWEDVFGPVIAGERLSIKAQTESRTDRRFAFHVFWFNATA